MCNTKIVKDKNGLYSLNQPLSKQEIIDVALDLQKGEFNDQPHLLGSDATKNFLHLHLSDNEREVFTVLFLNCRHILISCHDMFFGTVNASVAHPREIVKEALKQNASSIIIAHNHPSGIPEPSRADISMTQRIQDALELVEIKLLDHIIVGSGDVVSFAERGLII